MSMTTHTSKDISACSRLHRSLQLTLTLSILLGLYGYTISLLVHSCAALYTPRMYELPAHLQLLGIACGTCAALVSFVVHNRSEVKPTLRNLMRYAVSGAFNGWMGSVIATILFWPPLILVLCSTVLGTVPTLEITQLLWKEGFKPSIRKVISEIRKRRKP